MCLSLALRPLPLPFHDFEVISKQKTSESFVCDIMGLQRASRKCLVRFESFVSDGEFDQCPLTS